MLRLAEIGGKGKPDHNLTWLMISGEYCTVILLPALAAVQLDGQSIGLTSG